MFKVLLSVIFSYILAGVRVPFRLIGNYLPDLGINDIQIGTSLAEKPCPGCLKIPVYNSKDLNYFGQLYVGKDNMFKVLFDTGSNDLWLPSADCTGCPTDKRYNCKASTTCKMTKDALSVQYAMSSVEGYKGYEMAGFTRDAQVNYLLVWANQARGMANYKDVDAVIGLGNMEKSQDYIDLAYRNSYIKEKVFSFYLDHNPNTWRESKSSYLTIGYIPEDKINNLTWIPVTNPERWATKVKSIKIGSTIMDISLDSVAQEVVFDSGTSFFWLSGVLINELKNQLKDLDRFYGEEGAIFYRCDAEYLENYPNMTFRVRNMTMTLNVYSYLYFGQPGKESGKNYCQLAVMESTFGFLIFGASFFRNNFVAFSKKNQTIGIYQEYRPIVLLPPPDTSNQVWIIIVVLVGTIVGTVLIAEAIDRMFVSKKKKESNLMKEPLNQEQKNVETTQKIEEVLEEKRED